MYLILGSKKTQQTHPTILWKILCCFSNWDLYFWPNIFVSYLKTSPSPPSRSWKFLWKFYTKCAFIVRVLPLLLAASSSSLLKTEARIHHPAWVACPWVPTAPSWRWLKTPFPNASSLAFSGPEMADGCDCPQPLAGTLWGCLYLWGGFRRREVVIWQWCGCGQDREPSWLPPSFPHW